MGIMERTGHTNLLQSSSIKKTPQLRFICGSGYTPFTSQGGVLTSIFRLVAQEYRTVLCPAAFPNHPQCKSWFFLDSGTVMNNIYAFNHCQIPASTVIYPSAWDFTRMYTNIPQGKLIHDLMVCVQWCFQQPAHAGSTLHKYAGIRVVTGKSPSANFIKHGDYHHGAAKFSKTAQ